MKNLLLCLGILIIGTASFSQSKGQMDRRINIDALPKDILKPEYVLLVKVAFDNKKMVARYEEVMQEHYSGKYIIVPYDSPIDVAFPDNKKYRFILAAPNSLSKKDFKGANAEIANKTKGIAPTSAWSKDFHMVDRQNLEQINNTNLSGQNDVKVMAYLADRLSGKEGGE